MSGIVGIYRLDGGPADPADLGRMSETIAHRGPDSEGTHTDGSLALGHRMLWSTPESLGEKLPREDPTCELVITADARVDNREDLFARLGLSGHQSRRISDSELILAAYRAWGERCVDRLLGDFAFAIWDKRRQSLFCARDHFGVRLFYYYLSNGLFAFASEIKGLLCLPSVPRRLNELKVAGHLASIDDDVTSTFYTDIARLPPSHSMTVDGNGARLSSYWSLDPSREVRLSSDGEYAESFREIFTEAVRCRLRSAYPVGSMLSGGLDSTSITCVARELLAQSGGGPLSTFSAVFDTVARSNERGFIEAALAQNGVRPYFLHADKVSPLTDFEQVLWHQDEALDAGNLYVNWCLYRAAREQGVRVLLDGFDGDTTVSHGTGYFIELAQAGRWISLAQEVRAYTKHFDGVAWPRLLAAWVWRYGISPKTSNSRALMSLRGVLRALLGRRTASVGSIWSAGLSPSFVQRIGLAERRKALKKAPPRTEREQHYGLLTWPAMPHVLETLNKAGGAFRSSSGSRSGTEDWPSSASHCRLSRSCTVVGTA